MVTHRVRYIVLIFSLIPLLAPLWLLAADVPVTVNDITQLNPIEVQAALAPTTLEEIISAIKTHRGPISIGGGRFSMGELPIVRGKRPRL